MRRLAEDGAEKSLAAQRQVAHAMVLLRELEMKGNKVTPNRQQSDSFGHELHCRNVSQDPSLRSQL